MDISDNAYLSASGCSLNTSERAGLEAALLAQRAAKVKDPQFWGKIEGTGGDYLITQSIVEGFSAVPTKKFYYTYVSCLFVVNKTLSPYCSSTLATQEEWWELRTEGVTSSK